MGSKTVVKSTVVDANFLSECINGAMAEGWMFVNHMVCQLADRTKYLDAKVLVLFTKQEEIVDKSPMELHQEQVDAEASEIIEASDE